MADAKLSACWAGWDRIVYRARQLRLDRIVAIKILKSISTGDPHTIRRFIREAKAASELIHPNAGTVYGFGVSGDGEAYIVLEFLEGHRLSDLLAREGPLTLRRALHTCGQVGRELASACLFC